jgi:hypothetical protein
LADLAPSTIRYPEVEEAKPNPEEVNLTADAPIETSNVVELRTGGAVITIGVANPAAGALKDAKFDANLAETLDLESLGVICEELLQGIDQDDLSRKEWLEDRARGIKWLALRTEDPTADSQSSAAGNANLSRTRHTMLLDAVLRFQANARGEMLPADGPVKVSATMEDNSQGDIQADDLERELNYYLTNVAREYVPDTDRMLFWVGAGGLGIKKVYRCPIRRRPVSESIDPVDVIVSNGATDLTNADRVTVVCRMRQSVMKRMQKLGVYRDVDLGLPSHVIQNSVDEEKASITGIAPSQRMEDVPYTVYECYCQIDVPGDEQKEKGKETGLPRPYKVSIDRSSRTILEIRRNWRQEDELELPRQNLVVFPFVPALGFYALGLMHIMGNPTAAATAMQRVAIDSAIFSNFPGFLYAKGAGKQNTMDMTVAPGGGTAVDVSGSQNGNIRDVIMPLPYQQPGAALFQIFQEVVKAGSAVGGAPDISIGEGKQEAPVGTTIAMLEQAVKVMDAVHKRLHFAQADEFNLLRDLFLEYPEDFVKFNRKRNPGWDTARFLTALQNKNLIPKSDPNIASDLQRVMRAWAMYQMAQTNPELFDVHEVQDYVLRIGLKVQDPMRFVNKAPPQNAGAPDPQMLKAQASIMDAQTKQGKLQLEAKTFDASMRDQQQDRQTELASDQYKYKTEQLIHGAKLAGEVNRQKAETQRAMMGIAADRNTQARDQMHERQQDAMQQAHERSLEASKQAHERVTEAMKPKPQGE